MSGRLMGQLQRFAGITALALLAMNVGAAEIRALLVPEVEAVLSAESAGRITGLPVDEGDRVAPGDLLVAFDCTIPKARLDKARAELSGAVKTVESNRKLSQLGSFSQLELAQSEAKADEARAAVKEAQEMVRRCTLPAPFGGRVVERMVNNHESVSQGQELLELLDDRSLRLDLFVPSRWLSWIENGTPFEVYIDETGGRYQAVISAIGARVDAVSQSIKIRGRIAGEHPELLAGMSGEAFFEPPPAE